MPFTTPDYAVVRDAILRDIANLRPEAYIGADSDYAVRAAAVGAAIEGLYQHQQWLARQILPDTAEAEYLDRWSSIFGLTRRPASVASGTITFSGTSGAAVPIGTEARTLAGVAYLTTVAGTIGGGGTVSLAAAASVAGTGGNAAATTPLTLSSAPPAVSSAATIGTMTGGAEIETDASLLDRLLDRIQLPPQGGAAHDYIAWALEVAGVATAYCYPLRRGVGTVDVVILAAGGNVPSGGLISSTQANIDAKRPVTADCLVSGPTLVPVAVTASLTLSGTTLVTATATITSLLAAYFGALKPGGTVIATRIGALIAEVPGVVDYVLTAPSGNVTTLVDSTHIELATLGTVTLT